MQKRERQEVLMTLIRSTQISSQSELADRLTDRGFHVTQASISRDLDELGIAKINGHYAIPKAPNPIAEFGSVSFDTAGESLIVGKCGSGMASAITVRIDALAIPMIVGTIAGDDTIFIAVKDHGSQVEVLDKLESVFK